MPGEVAVVWFAIASSYPQVSAQRSLACHPDVPGCPDCMFHCHLQCTYHPQILEVPSKIRVWY